MVGRKGRRSFSSGGVQVFQLLREVMGPVKLTASRLEGQWAVLVQSQRRQRFLIMFVVGLGRGEIESLERWDEAEKIIEI